MNRTLQAGFEDVRAQRMELPTVEPVLDALDWLEETERASRGSALESSLTGIVHKLATYLDALEIKRLHADGERVDPRLFRIAKVVEDSAPGGTIVRCLRAAVLFKGELVREGDVVVSAGRSAA